MRRAKSRTELAGVEALYAIGRSRREREYREGLFTNSGKWFFINVEEDIVSCWASGPETCDHCEAGAGGIGGPHC